MRTIIGIDFGIKHIGVAAAEIPNGFPHPIAVWQKAQGEAERLLVELISEKKAELLVVGLPLNESGEETTSSERVRNFCRRLARRISIPLFLVDESDSSGEALERLQQAHKSRASQRELDAFSACIILERYLDPEAAYHVGNYRVTGP